MKQTHSSSAFCARIKPASKQNSTGLLLSNLYTLLNNHLTEVLKSKMSFIIKMLSLSSDCYIFISHTFKIQPKTLQKKKFPKWALNLMSFFNHTGESPDLCSALCWCHITDVMHFWCNYTFLNVILKKPTVLNQTWILSCKLCSELSFSCSRYAFLTVTRSETHITSINKPIIPASFWA